MKSLRYGFNLTASHLLCAAAMFLLNLQIAAQPGDESVWYEKTVEGLKVLDGKILRRPNDADLHFQRGNLYLALFERHPEVAEFRGLVYANDTGGKALTDLNRAIHLDPAKGVYHVALGRFYDTRWRHALSRWTNADASSWQKTKELFWDDRSFDSAVKEYETAIYVERDGSLISRPLSLLAWLYRTRASSLSSATSAKTLRAENQTKRVFDDYDRSLEFTRRCLNRQGLAESIFLIRDIYRDKARAAIEFEDYTTGINILSDGVSEIRETTQDTSELCGLYSLRGDIRMLIKDYDGALQDFTYPIAQKYPNCDSIHEKRGDVLAAKRQWRQAIEDYSQELVRFSYPHVSLLTRRANAYLEIGEAEKAVADLDQAMTYHKSCSEQYQLRARAYWILKKDDHAADDEKTAARLSKNKIGCAL